MQKLLEGIHQFQAEDFVPLQLLFEQLAKGQNPETLFITCSDSRIVPTMLTKAKPGDLFILRNAGNIVPPHGTGHGGEAATIEYAVAALSVNNIIICGHSLCGAIQGLLHPEQVASLPASRHGYRTPRRPAALCVKTTAILTAMFADCHGRRECLGTA